MSLRRNIMYNRENYKTKRGFRMKKTIRLACALCLLAALALPTTASVAEEAVSIHSVALAVEPELNLVGRILRGAGRLEGDDQG